VPENVFVGPLATEYEQRWPHLFEPGAVDPAVDFLARAAGRGPVLEFGIGTGRLAVPLRRRGLRVDGIELSDDMVAALRTHVGPDAVGVTVGDFASAQGPGGLGTYALVYLVRNTIMNLTTQDEQVACFRNAAAHLAPGGRFVMEVIVPELRRLPPGTTARAFAMREEHIGVDEFDVATQRSWSHHFWFAGDGRAETFSAPFRYVWPAELDLMARLAGLSRRERWADWDEAPFGNDSRTHVSVWEKPQAAAPAG